MTDELHLLLARREGTDRAAFDTAIQALAEDIPVALLAQAAPGETLSALPHVSGDAPPPLWEATLTVPVETKLEGLADRLSATVDPASSTIVAGRRHEILPGVAPIRLSFMLRRLDALSPSQFRHYWLNVHADFGRQLMPPYSYYQIHASTNLSLQAAARAGFPAPAIDGIGEVHFPDMAALARHLTGSDVTAQALIDERNFIDHGRSSFAIYTLLTI